MSTGDTMCLSLRYYCTCTEMLVRFNIRTGLCITIEMYVNSELMHLTLSKLTEKIKPRLQALIDPWSLYSWYIVYVPCHL